MELESGRGELLCSVDPDEFREWVRDNKLDSKVMKSKVMSAEEAVRKFVHDGDYLAIGGTGVARGAIGLIMEIIRQNRKNLGLLCCMREYDIHYLINAGCVDRLDIGYSGMEYRGGSIRSRVMESKIRRGEIKVCEWTNGITAWRMKAAAMGVPFIPVRSALGTETFERSAGKVVQDPFTGKKVLLVPAAYADVAIIHVHRCDEYGNVQVTGASNWDYYVARASKRVIVSTEEIIDVEDVRREPWRTIIPHFYVDAVVEMPYGSHPVDMPYKYWFDYPIIDELVEATTDEGKAQEFIEKYVLSVSSHEEYLDKIGGVKKLRYLERLARDVLR
ncbi:MAG: CoA transferase subunit A [Clostridia bacterium]|nr:CoA transferase subunit A [Clostridia bacterium]